MTRKPRPPQHLDGQAKAKWRELAPTLDVTLPGVADALGAYCVAYSRWTQAEAQVAALGLVVKSPAGFPVENPYLGIVKRAMVEMHRWGKELGIVSRSAKPAADAPDSLDEKLRSLSFLAGLPQSPAPARRRKA
jgi:P27 family predicted phage terminase small subunit